MNVHYQDGSYTIEDLGNLKTKFPHFSMLVDFLLQWDQGSDLFEFKSSGSTGTPKTISIKRSQIEASIKATASHLDLQATDHVLLCLSPEYIASIMMAARALYLDMDLWIINANSNPLNKVKSKIDFASFVPFQIYKMIGDGSIALLKKIRNVLIGGAPLEDWAIKILASYPNNIYLTYGMTETVSHVALRQISGTKTQENYEFVSGIEAGKDDRECLWLKGEVTCQEILQTNDMVDINERNGFRWLGRYDNIINSGGIKINPETIDKIISEILLEQNYFVGSIHDSTLGEKLILLIEGVIDQSTFKRIQNNITQQLSKHHSPKSYHCLASFLYTASGKIKRNETLNLLG
ncbi:MAG: AMP-binding protein [Reichenbachiella sp.]